MAIPLKSLFTVSVLVLIDCLIGKVFRLVCMGLRQNFDSHRSGNGNNGSEAVCSEGLAVQHAPGALGEVAPSKRCKCAALESRLFNFLFNTHTLVTAD